MLNLKFLEFKILHLHHLRVKYNCILLIKVMKVSSILS